MTNLELLKFNLMETNFPYFSDADLQTLLDLNNNDVRAASYAGCMMKAQDDSVNLGPIKTPSNEKLWLRRAKMFRGNSTGTIPTSPSLRNPSNTGIALRIDELNPNIAYDCAREAE